MALRGATVASYHCATCNPEAPQFVGMPMQTQASQAPTPPPAPVIVIPGRGRGTADHDPHASNRAGSRGIAEPSRGAVESAHFSRWPAVEIDHPAEKHGRSGCHQGTPGAAGAARRAATAARVRYSNDGATAHQRVSGNDCDDYQRAHAGRTRVGTSSRTVDRLHRLRARTARRSGSLAPSSNERASRARRQWSSTTWLSASREWKEP